ncbi:hypothetical protein Syun_007389 [Stephania yunnanensis]|uniref:Uncharacterized protein n=1 Tax=Stephania yunnanensis TaxID=152371 RepID=A0AAP0PYN3_9MAGN
MDSLFTLGRVVKMAPFEAFFGRAPPFLLDYVHGDSIIAAVDDHLSDRSFMIATFTTKKQQIRNGIRNGNKIRF